MRKLTEEKIEQSRIFYTNVEYVMKQNGINYSDLERLSGIHRNNLYYNKAQKTLPHLWQAILIANALEITLDYLVKDHNPQQVN